MTKSDRARRILATIQELDQQRGQLGPAPSSDPAGFARYVKLDDGWAVRLIPDCSFALLPIGKLQLAERKQYGTGYTAVEVTLHQSRYLALHYRGEKIEVVEFRPGKWERRFGTDCGDDTTHYRRHELPSSPSALAALRVSAPGFHVAR